jgi:hypothetical protein
MFGIELNRRLVRAGKNVLSVSAHPGFSLGTGLIKGKGMRFFIKYTMGFLSHSPAASGIYICKS